MAQRKIVWSTPARKDLHELRTFIRQDSAYYANRFVSRILARVNLLQESPLQGRQVPELLEENIREVFVNPYRLIYRVSREEILILSLVHMSRDFDGAGN